MTKVFLLSIQHFRSNPCSSKSPYVQPLSIKPLSIQPIFLLQDGEPYGDPVAVIDEQGNSQLELTGVSADSAGQYACQVTYHSIGSLMSQTKTVHVRGV